VEEVGLQKHTCERCYNCYCMAFLSVRTIPSKAPGIQYLGTEQNCFGQKTDEIANFCILDGKRNSQFGQNLDKNAQMVNLLPEIIVNLFHIPWLCRDVFYGWFERTDA